ncbi:MAG: VOC family protein [Thermomicrobiales bacterium]
MSVMTVATATGRFVWHDLRTTDFGKAVAFYTELFGWRIAPDQIGGRTAHLFSHDGRAFGGVSQLTADQDGAPSHWLCSISVPDVDLAVATAARLGGRIITPPFDLVDVGRFSILADPTGARFALAGNVDDAPDVEQSEVVPGGICWHDLATADPGDMTDFYADVVGWGAEPAEITGRQHTIFTSGERWAAGLFRKPNDVPASTWAVYVRVANIEATLDRVKRLGGSQVVGIIAIPDSGRFCGVADPTGAIFALHEPPPDL